jgi:hypothetical protein
MVTITKVWSPTDGAQFLGKSQKSEAAEGKPGGLSLLSSGILPGFLRIRFDRPPETPKFRGQVTGQNRPFPSHRKTREDS